MWPVEKCPGFQLGTARASSRRRAAPSDPRIAVLLHEALLNPHLVLEENLEDLLLVHVIGDLLRQTLQNSVQGEDLEDLHSDANRRLPLLPSSSALKKLGPWRRMADTPNSIDLQPPCVGNKPTRSASVQIGDRGSVGQLNP